MRSLLGAWTNSCSMLKSGAKIIPVFYDVRRSDLRWVGKGKGAYADAFAKHQKRRRFSSEKVAESKAALQQLSNLHGLELNGTEFQGDWGKLLKSIVYTVLEAIVDKVPLEVGEDRVGLDEAIHDFQNFMQSEQQNKNEAVKIVGIGGSGKTTLAKQFYNLHRSSFTKSSFLFDVRHRSAPQNLQSLQSKLLKDLLDIYQANIRSVAEGRAILRDRLRSSTPRVLIVLDDIDHESQIEDLLVKDVLGSDSLVLITSRDEGALRRHSGAASVYKIKPLNPKHAQDRFCRHAFGQPHPKIGFEDLVEDFCEKCGRFPLSLKVMGAHLRVNGNDNRDEWREELEYKPDDIRYILKISSDALSSEEKQIFLDIACFFLGERESMAIRVWNRNLKNKCLVEVDDGNRLRMHDHLRDFAKDIANIDSPFRFWQLAQITNILKPSEKRMGIRGLMAATSEHGDCLSCNHMAFEKMELSRLKLLVIKGGCFQKRFGQASTNLMWLRWYGFPHTKIPSWLISIKNLRVLQLISGTLEEWRVSEKQLPLKELVIQNTRLSEISIPEDVCPCLELLDLSFNKCLTEIKHLPTTLVVLNLEGCRLLKRMTLSSELKNLRLLNLRGCRELEELPDLNHLSSLETLEAWGCSRLQSVRGLEHLLKLRKLDIPRCSELLELPDLSHLSSLETLEARDCSKLQSIQGLNHLPKLQMLDIRGCSELRELPNLSHLSSLEMLDVWGCSKLQSVRGLEHPANCTRFGAPANCFVSI